MDLGFQKFPSPARSNNYSMLFAGDQPFMLEGIMYITRAFLKLQSFYIVQEAC